MSSADPFSSSTYNMTLKTFLLLAIASFAPVLCKVQGAFEQEHMNEAHHIEVKDEVTFFKLHDLDKDGFWDEKELKSMYGLERDIDPNANHIKLIIDRVYQEMDLNRDRFISMDEYMNARLPTISIKEKKVEEEIIQKRKNEPKKQKKNQKKVKKADPPPVNVNKRSGNYVGVPNKFRA